MYVGQTSAKLIGGGGYNMIPMDMNIGGQQSLMMDPADCVCITVCLSVCLPDSV